MSDASIQKKIDDNFDRDSNYEEYDEDQHFIINQSSSGGMQK